MRWAVGLLLILNIGLYMWGSWYEIPRSSIGPESRPPVNADKLRPLSGRLPGPRGSAVQGGLTDGTRRCAVLGPFDTAAQVEAVAEILTQQGFTGPRQRQLQERAASYRVYLPSLGSRQAAERRRTQLTKLGFKDHYIIDERDRENAISLGVFASQQNAAAHARQLSEKGVKAKLETVYGLQTTHWLDLELGAEELGRLRSLPLEAPRAQLSERPCVGLDGEKARTQEAGG